MPIPEEARHIPDTPEHRTLDERSSHCFGCSPANPQGLHLKFAIDAEAITATAPVNLTRLHEGPPGYIHGGIIAALFDEAMSKLNRPLGVLAMTRNLQVDFLRPSPLSQPLTVTGKHLRREGRKLFHEAQLTDQDGTILAKATGLFIIIDPRLIPPTTQPASPQ